MKTTAIAAGLAVMVLAGCSMQPTVRNADEEHSRPALTVRYGVLAVSPDPVLFHRTKDRGPITFQAPDGYTFPGRNGIEVLGLVVDRNNNPVPPDPKALKDSAFELDAEGKKAFDCRFDDKNPREVACHPTAALKRGVYRYAMRVVGKDGKRIESDPHIFAMD